jgi:MFS family permease
MADTVSRPKSSAIAPLQVPVFRDIWLAAICSNTGLFMQDLASAWLMTSLSQAPMMIALMQTAAMLPYFLLGLPAGAYADIVNRRKLLL